MGGNRNVPITTLEEPAWWGRVRPTCWLADGHRFFVLCPKRHLNTFSSKTGLVSAAVHEPGRSRLWLQRDAPLSWAGAARRQAEEQRPGPRPAGEASPIPHGVKPQGTSLSAGLANQALLGGCCEPADLSKAQLGSVPLGTSDPLLV